MESLERNATARGGHGPEDGGGWTEDAKGCAVLSALLLLGIILCAIFILAIIFPVHVWYRPSVHVDKVVKVEDSDFEDWQEYKVHYDVTAEKPAKSWHDWDMVYEYRLGTDDNNRDGGFVTLSGPEDEDLWYCISYGVDEDPPPCSEHSLPQLLSGPYDSGATTILVGLLRAPNDKTPGPRQMKAELVLESDIHSFVPVEAIVLVWFVLVPIGSVLSLCFLVTFTTTLSLYGRKYLRKSWTQTSKYSNVPMEAMESMSPDAGAIRRYELLKHAKTMLGSGDLKTAVQLPHSEDQNEWLAVNTVEFFNQIKPLYDSIGEFCTEEACPMMSAGSGYEYYWADGEKIKDPIKCSAPKHIGYLMEWVQGELNDETIFPARADVPFPKSFLPAVKTIFKRLFRVYAHIYCSHFEQVVTLGEEAHLNTCFKHFYHFVVEFNLVDEREMAPLQEHINLLIGSHAASASSG